MIQGSQQLSSTMKQDDLYRHDGMT